MGVTEAMGVGTRAELNGSPAQVAAQLRGEGAKEAAMAAGGRIIRHDSSCGNRRVGRLAHGVESGE